MDCANVTKNTDRLPHLPNGNLHPPPPPDEHALYKDNFATWNGELSKVIADVAESDGNVLFVFHEH